MYESFEYCEIPLFLLAPYSMVPAFSSLACGTPMRPVSSALRPVVAPNLNMSSATLMETSNEHLGRAYDV